MYEEFYGLTKRPFSTVPGPDGLFWSDAHSQAFAMLRYGVLSRAPITVLTGEIGAGKTALVRRLLAEDDVAELTVALISGMTSGQGSILEWILMSLGEPVGDGHPVRTFARLQDVLIRCYAEGGRSLVIVDEAQNLDPGMLEELRLLTNINADGDELLQLVLVGQPQLRERLRRPELQQFSQRIAADFHLGRLNGAETADYVATRLRTAGAARSIFPTSTCAQVYAVTGGNPRLINVLCDLALVYGYADDREVVEEDLLREVLEAARRRGIFDQFPPPSTPLSLVAEAEPGASGAHHRDSARRTS